MKILLLILLALILSSCNNDSNPAAPTTIINNSYLESPYKGNWNITFRNSIGTSILSMDTIIVRADGSFSNSFTFYSTQNFIFSGDVRNNGQLENGNLFSNGTISNGDVTGIFSDNVANGVWKAATGTGIVATWTGIKQ